MLVGLTGYRPCIRFHSSCAATATAYAVSAFSFVSIRVFYIAGTRVTAIIMDGKHQQQKRVTAM